MFSQMHMVLPIAILPCCARVECLFHWYGFQGFLFSNRNGAKIMPHVNCTVCMFSLLTSGCFTAGGPAWGGSVKSRPSHGKREETSTRLCSCDLNKGLMWLYHFFSLLWYPTHCVYWWCNVCFRAVNCHKCVVLPRLVEVGREGFVSEQNHLCACVNVWRYWVC